MSVSKIKILLKQPNQILNPSINLSTSTNTNLIDLKLYQIEKQAQSTKVIKGKTLIIDVLSQLVEHTRHLMETTTGDERKKQQFRVTQFSKAVERLREFSGDITSGAQAKQLDGIGKGIADRINEILTTGTLSELKTTITIDDKTRIMTELCTVTGIGDANAKKFYEAGVTSVEDLRQKSQSGVIKITHHMQIGLQYYHDIQTKIPYSEVAEMATILRQSITQIDPLNQFLVEVCGSHRRQKAMSGDIDVLITHQQIQTDEDLIQSKETYLKNIVSQLKKTGLIKADLTSLGNSKYMGIAVLDKIKIGRRIDIRFVSYEAYFPALLYFTGSMTLNKLMRTIALEKGFTLNEYGLYRYKDGQKGEQIKINSEQDIFIQLGIKYLQPIEREF